jgi:multisubunit Na+/H+ antiporter MnhG subunit
MAGLRVICLLSGYALVIIGALGLLHVPWSTAAARRGLSPG